MTDGNTVNVASFQQDSLFTYHNWQYTAWYRNDLRAVIARRELPHGSWQSTELDYLLWSDDAHNAISMAVSPSDGRIHVAFPTHTEAIRYTRSIAGVASDPEDFEWSSQLFEATYDYLPGAPDAPPRFTYPQFEVVRDSMLMTWREGGATNGRQLLFRYDDNEQGSWTFLGRFTDMAGSWTGTLGTSTSRYAYLHGFSENPANGNLEIAFTWNESYQVWCSPSGAGNHDLGYAYSPDLGLSWFNNQHVRIGLTSKDIADPIAIDDDQVVVPMPMHSGLMNQEAQAFDSKGRLHVMTSRIPDGDLEQLDGCVDDFYVQRAQFARPYHSYRQRDGTWLTSELPVRTNQSGRSKLAFDVNDMAYVVLPDARIVASTAESGWSDWQVVFDAADVQNVSELVIDRQRLLLDGVLSVAYQEPSALPDAASAYRVADFAIGRKAKHQPRSDTAQVAPVPFAGSAD